jgi:hypothetical protein
MEKKCYPTIKEAIFLCLILFVIEIGMAFIFGLVSALYGFSTGSQIDGRVTYFSMILLYALVTYIGYKKHIKKSAKYLCLIMFHYLSGSQ